MVEINIIIHQFYGMINRLKSLPALPGVFHLLLYRKSCLLIGQNIPVTTRAKKAGR